MHEYANATHIQAFHKDNYPKVTSNELSNKLEEEMLGHENMCDCKFVHLKINFLEFLSVVSCS